MGLARSLVRLTVASGCVLGSLVFPPLLAGQEIAWGRAFATALGSVAAGNTANAIDALTAGKDAEIVSLQNAVGKAIAAVIALAAKDRQYPRNIRKHLKTITLKTSKNWVRLAQWELSQHLYAKLSRSDRLKLTEAQLPQLFTPSTPETILTSGEWRNIFVKLDLMADPDGHFELPPSVIQAVAELLHTTFPKALRETLKADFASGGKAFAELTLQLLAGMKAEIAQLRNAGTNTAQLTSILDGFESVETQLRGTEAQQQDLFRGLSQQIYSGFAEVCQQLGAIETNITQLLRVSEDIGEKVADLHDSLIPQTLTLEEWRAICRQNLPLQKDLTTTKFGVAKKLDDLYVPLASVERKQAKPRSGNQQEKKEEETLIPIAEYRFFEEVLQRGQSKISQGRRIAIIGELGSGKTTRLQKIADWILKKKLGLPIWVSLADFTQPTIYHYIEEIWLKKAELNLPLEALAQQKDRIWLLLDGLDEMTARVDTRHVDKLLRGWMENVRVIVTCRVNVWEADKNALSGFDVFRNLPFETKQVELFIRRWFEAIN